MTAQATKHNGPKPAFQLIDTRFRREVICANVIPVNTQDSIEFWARGGSKQYLAEAFHGVARQFGTASPRQVSELELARVLAHGAAKYDRGSINFRAGHLWSDMWRATHGHLRAHGRGDIYDLESGLLHLSHALGQLMMLWVHQRDELGIDDRASIWSRS